MKALKYSAVAGSVLLATSAFALPPGEITAPTNPILRIYFSGATATDNALQNLFRKTGAGQICETNSLDVYFVGAAGSNNRMFFCRSNPTLVPGLSGTVNLMFLKESVSGSGNGVIPVADGTPLTFLNPNALDAGANCQTGAAVAASGSLMAFTQRTNCVGTQSVAATGPNAQGTVPIAGISDVDPFVNLATQAQIDKLSPANPGVGVVFGAPVSLNLWNALRVAQGLTVNQVNGPQCATTPDQPACTPSISLNQLRLIYSGFVTDWSVFTDRNGAALPTAPGVTAPADSTIRVCRRGQTSGTQATAESYVLNQRCISGVTEFVSPNDGSNPVAGTVFNAGVTPSADPAQNVFAGGGSGDVRSCLDFHDDGNRWAIGILSTENCPNGTDREYGFLRIDGMPTSVDAVVNGGQSYFTENTINWRNGAGLLDADARTPNANEQAVLDKIVTDVGRPSVVAGVNSGFRCTTPATLDGGLLTIPSATFPPIVTTANPPEQPVVYLPPYDRVAEVREYPVNNQQRLSNNCIPPAMSFQGQQVIGGQNL